MARQRWWPSRSCSPGHVNTRALGLSIAYAFGVALFGGTAQLVITWLIKVTNNPAAPALYVLVTSLIAIVGILLMRETGGDKNYRNDHQANFADCEFIA